VRIELAFISIIDSTFSDSIVYIPANDAAVHRQTAMMQLAQEMDNNAAISTFKPLPTVTR
jgi:hypothetical protein